jgi:1,4-alpha-glucan branching enzyme
LFLWLDAAEHLYVEEVGAMKKFLYGEVLNNREDLIGMQQSFGNGLFRFYQAVIRLRLNRDRPALRSRNIEIVEASNGHRVLVFRRWLNEQNFLIVASLNNLAFDRPSYIVNSSRLGLERWKETFNSDSTEYGGNGIGNLGGIIPSGAGWLECVIPANGLVVLERV